MTLPLERTALILLAGTALTACASPSYPIHTPLVQVPPHPAVAPPAGLAQAPGESPGASPTVPTATTPVQAAELAPLAPAAARPVAPHRAGAPRAEPPVLALAPTGQDVAARAQGRGGPATYTVRSGDTLAGIAQRLGTDVQALARANGLSSPYRIRPGQVLRNPNAASPAARARPAERPAQAPTPGAGESYRVQPGDTLFGLAVRFGVTVDAIRAANGMSDGAQLMAGRTLRIPGQGASAPAPAPDEDAELAERLASRTQVAPEPPPAGPSRPPPAATDAERTTTTRLVTGRVVDVQVPGEAYKVKAGDNLDRIARRLDSTVAELARINKLKAPYTLQPGQTIRGPGSTAKAYVTVRGDTVADVARRFGVTEAQLRSANGLRRGAGLAVGRRLTLPAGYRDRGPITTTVRAPAPAPTPAPGRPTTTPTSETPPPVAQPSRPPPRPPTSGLPDRPQPYQTPPGGVAGAPTPTPPPSDVQIAEMGRGLFIWPLRGAIISNFGGRGQGPRNDGLNIRAGAGEPVRAAADGDVVYAGDQVPGFGNLVLVKHDDGWVTAYGHLGRVDVRMQQKVTQGQQIGQAGATGGVSEPQLHFEIRYAPNPQERARPIDPNLVLPR
ncbi:LysM peptidoglycan-binding domain-containing M23 family metallopeptidase [Phenylobacterium sp.]|uniref:LysM peptidoglycan-binding domain-containing M23 family metallopeptidase n=1 Tax=Phenylobacterium sp. TaxID=1871053 RepID=UPI00301D53D2